MPLDPQDAGRLRDVITYGEQVQSMVLGLQRMSLSLMPRLFSQSVMAFRLSERPPGS
jgi:hypothetical protein